MNIDMFFWIGFSIIFILIFIIDMFFTGKRKDRIEIKTALMWSGVWVSTALIFGALIYFYFPMGSVKSFEFIASYLIEYSLSVDNFLFFYNDFWSDWE